VGIVQFAVEVCALLVHFMWITQHYGIESVHIRRMANISSGG